jgi:hypothetical protein
MNKSLPSVLLVVALSACSQSVTPTTPVTDTPVSKNVAIHEDPAKRAARVGAAKKVMPSYAEADTQVDHAIDNLLGDHTAYHQAITDFQGAVAANDSGRVAAMVRYPITVQYEGKPVVIESAIKFKQYYGKLISPEAAKSIADSRYSDVKISVEGVLLGDGQTFMSGQCLDAGCKKMDIKISSMQQPMKKASK